MINLNQQQIHPKYRENSDFLSEQDNNKNTHSLELQVVFTQAIDLVKNNNDFKDEEEHEILTIRLRRKIAKLAKNKLYLIN